MKKIIVILGPTASGKSNFAIRIAKMFGGEIISADSRQVYRGLDIGSGKLTKKERQGIKHYLLDVVSPKQYFSAGRFQKLAKKIIGEIFKKGKIPIICGGTYFYAKALIEGLVFPSVAPNWKLRKKLENMDSERLFKMLKKLDPQRAENIERKNKRRLIRAIEIANKLGKIPPVLKERPKYSFLIIGLKKDTKTIDLLIRKRFYGWLKRGLVGEVVKLKKMGLSDKRIEEFGLHYKILLEYIKGKITKREMIERSIREIQRYAKRQLRWLMQDKRIIWVRDLRVGTKIVRDYLFKFSENS